MSEKQGEKWDRWLARLAKELGVARQQVGESEGVSVTVARVVAEVSKRHHSLGRLGPDICGLSR
jgi:hypothetical protein